MKTILMRDVINDTAPTDNPEMIYVIRDGDIVFYVGKAEGNMIDRLRGHLGLTGWGWDHIGNFVEDNIPESDMWSVDLLRPVECLSAIEIYLYDGKLQWDNTDDLHDKVMLAEQAKILELGPALNKIGNLNRKRLPEKYLVKTNAKLLAGHRKVFPWKED